MLLTSEIRDAETAEQAIQGGESGSLMIATTHGKSVTGTMRKILSYTGTSADVMRSVLAGNLIAVVRQALVPSKDGKRYLMAADVLFNTGKVTQFIERGDWIGLESAIREDNAPRRQRMGADEQPPRRTRPPRRDRGQRSHARDVGHPVVEEEAGRSGIGTVVRALSSGSTRRGPRIF